MGSVSESPFRAIDEIDIYMDSKSRKEAMGTLVQDALQRQQQLILITPGDVTCVRPCIPAPCATLHAARCAPATANVLTCHPLVQPR